MHHSSLRSNRRRRQKQRPMRRLRRHLVYLTAYSGNTPQLSFSVYALLSARAIFIQTCGTVMLYTTGTLTAR